LFFVLCSLFLARTGLLLMSRGETTENILQRCLERIAAGESIAACLRDHPEHADELAPLLEAVAELRGWAPPTLSPAARSAGRARAHTALDALRERRSRRWWRFWNGGMRLALGAALTLLLLLGTLGISVAAAQSSLPGQPLYGLKRQSEELRLQLAPSAEQQAELRLQFAGRRLEEALAEVGDCASATDLLSDMAQEYDKAWQAITQLDPAAQARLRARFEEAVRTHRQALDAAQRRATSTCVRIELDRARNVNDGAAEHVATPTATSTPTPTLTYTPTPRPVVRRTPTPLPTAAPTDTPTSVPTDTPTDTPTATPQPRRSDSSRPRRATPEPTDQPPEPAPTDGPAATSAPDETPIETPIETPNEAPNATPTPADGYPAPPEVTADVTPGTSIPPDGEPTETPGSETTPQPEATSDGATPQPDATSEPGATPDSGPAEPPPATDKPIPAPTAGDKDVPVPGPTTE
jgi:hypothetical protein